jgi:hypothetical protein
MVIDPYDRTSRYLLRKYEVLLAWLLGLASDSFDFKQWLDTRHIPWPGAPERICDTVAHLRDLLRHGIPWAIVVEFQRLPDPDMFGRLLIYMGQVYLDLRPTDLPGDRFFIGAVVVNLTGKGSSGRDLAWPEAGLRTLMQPNERNLSERSAAALLDDVEAGKVPRIVLAWLPLMQGGADPATITRWLAVAGQETDVQRRADLGQALVFAELADCLETWKEALKEWNVVESQVVKEWQRQARSEGETKGKADAILKVLEARGVTVPADLAAVVSAITDLARLDALLRLAAGAGSLEQFRRDAGL